MVGFLCIVFVVKNKDRPDAYGLTRKGIMKSVGIGLGLIGLQSAIYWLLSLPVVDPGLDAFTQSLTQPFPFNFAFALFTAFSYGPLQVFFMIFLVEKLDQFFGTNASKPSYKAIAITVIIWALPHILNVSLLGLTETLLQLLKMSAQGLLILFTFKYTRNSIGPMIYWTFIEIVQTY